MCASGRSLDDRLCKCNGCYYYRSMSGTSNYGMKGCHYCFETGQPRGIAPVDCYQKEGTPYRADKYVSKSKRIKLYSKKQKEKQVKEKKKMARQNFRQEIKDAAVRAVLVDGEPQAVVRERYGIAVSTLARWLSDARKEQKEYFDYADSIQAEQQAVEVVEVVEVVEEQPEQTAEVVAEEAAAVEETKTEETEMVENIVKTEGTQQSKKKLAENLSVWLFSLKHSFNKLDSVNLVNEEEKAVFNLMYTRANGFLLGLEYEEKTN